MSLVRLRNIFNALRSTVRPKLNVTTLYNVECIAADGSVRWKETFHNIVTTEGLNKILDACFKTGLASPAWYVGLVDNAGYTAFALTDIASKITATANPPTTNGWQEGVPYSNSVRPTWTPGTISAGSVDNSASKASFTINAPLTVRGCFLSSVSGKIGTTGSLYGVGDFTSPRAVVSGDTINVTVTPSVANP